MSFQTKRPWSLLLLGLLGLAATAVSASALLAEQSHLLAAGTNQQEKMEAFISGARQVGLATTTQRWFVIDCRNSTIFAFTSQAGTDAQQAISRRCQSGALEITQAAPASSFAWFGAAHASLALGEWDAMNTYLVRSYQTGAQEGWIARYRAELVADNYDRISPANLEGFRRDLVMLADNMIAFSDYLADEYLDKPALRTMLTEIVEATPPRAQRYFLESVNRIRRRAAAGQS